MQAAKAFEGRDCCALPIGGVRASAKPLVIRTVLGSCIAVCLFDACSGVGGMNHFMLPGRSDAAACTRYGVNAMELLINECMKLGADRRSLTAKVFGGGHVLAVSDAVKSVPQRNIAFVREFLERERIPVTASDLGGNDARKIYFFTDTARTLLKRIPCDRSSAQIRKIELIEGDYQSAMWLPAAPDDSNVTLF
jgi:chemotaxis protein CheD